MDASIYNGDSCWLCLTPGTFCNCEFSDSSWSKSASPESNWTFDGPGEHMDFDLGEPAFCATDGHHFLVGAVENPDFEIDDPGRGSHLPYAASSLKNNDDLKKWESSSAMAPPESSSPVGLDADSSPVSTDLASPTRTQCREGPAAVDRRLLCRPLDDGQWRVKASLNSRVYSNAPTFHTATSTSRSSHPSPTDFSMPPQESLNERLYAIDKRQIATYAHDVCTAMSRTAIERTNGIETPEEIYRVSVPRSVTLASHKRALFSGSTVINFAIPTESNGIENDKPHDATTTSSDATRDDDVPSNMPSRRVSLVLISCPDQATMDNRLKRRRSSVDYFQESKKTKLDRTLSRVSYTSDSSVQSKYKTTRPASFRRAESLRSDISACTDESTNSLFGPSPLSPLASRPCSDREYPPTVPSTPLPNSVDYARSRANPLIRTLVVYRRRTLEIPAIPPVPIIAPPPHLPPTVVRCAEDYAVDRLEALLLRERSERGRDGLNVHDEKRMERLKATYGTDPSFPRRDSASTCDSSDGYSHWDEETTCSVTESQGSQELAPRMKIQVLTEQYRLASRQTWINAYGIANDFRKEIAKWILEKVPKEPEPVREKTSERFRGRDLYDQLMNSSQTRFHAAQLFLRYFLLPEKVDYWREACKCEDVIPKSRGSCDDSDYGRGVWDLAVACMALSVKLHRDCLRPLSPVFAAEFITMAPYSMTHETLELAQRDVLYTFQFQLGSCTPQDVLDELWNALPTLRKATASIGWTVIQGVTWDKLFQSLLEPDMLQYPVTLLTAAALVDSLAFALASLYRTEAEANVCKCKVLVQTRVSECVLDDVERTTWQIHLHEANQLVDDVISDVKDVLHLTPMELDECRTWLNHVGQA